MDKLEELNRLWPECLRLAKLLKDANHKVATLINKIGEDLRYCQKCETYYAGDHVCQVDEE